MKSSIEKFAKEVSPLTAFFIGAALMCCAYALMTSILSIRLEGNGVSTTKAGLVMALYYLGYVFSSLKSYKIINKVGHIRTFTAYISIFSALSLMHYFDSNPLTWGVLRLLEGYCIGAATMCLESWLNARANNKNRGMVMSLYMVSTYLGSSTAQIMLNIPDPNQVTIYVLISILFSVCLVPISLTALPTPEISARKSMPLSKLYAKTPVGVIACFVSGCLVGAFYALGTIYTKKLGLDIHQTSMFMFFAVIGGMSAQIPVGRISDKMDRRYVILASCIILTFLPPIMHFVIGLNNFVLSTIAMILGASLFTIYPICVSHINDLVDDEERVQASGNLILLQGVGLIAGPVVVAFLMDHVGNICFALTISIISSSLILFIKKHISIKPDINYLNINPTVPIPVSTTAVFEDLATKDTVEDNKNKSAFRKINKDKDIT